VNAAATARVTVVSGDGPYADAWHDFAATSARLARVVAGLGHRVTVVGDVEPALTAPDADLLVVNVGNPAVERPADRTLAAADGVRRHLADGGALLAVHISIGALTDAPGWTRSVGGRWVWGRSHHPDIGTATIRLHAGVHPVVEGLHEVVVHDERYCDLEVADDVTVLGDHAEGGRHHPVVWARSGPGRVVYDGLGHDVRSFDSAGHVALLRRAVRWLLADG